MSDRSTAAGRAIRLQSTSTFFRPQTNRTTTPPINRIPPIDNAARRFIDIERTHTKTGIRMMIDITTTQVGQCCFVFAKGFLSMVSAA
jgi:hypothetical protein